MQTPDATLKIWQVNPGHTHAIIYFGGNGEDPAGKLDLYSTLFPQHTLYAVNYRGYGGSTGKPSQAGLFKDALGIYDHIKGEHISISAIGWSLGSGIATYLASERDIRKLALVAPYDSILNVAKQQYPFYPISHMLQDHYDALAFAPAVKSKILLLVAENDQLIPPPHTMNLSRALPKNNQTTVLIPSVNHDSIGYSQEYLRHMNDFFSSD